VANNAKDSKLPFSLSLTPPPGLFLHVPPTVITKGSSAAPSFYTHSSPIGCLPLLLPHTSVQAHLELLTKSSSSLDLLVALLHERQHRVLPFVQSRTFI
jgi:hypothetical protein